MIAEPQKVLRRHRLQNSHLPDENLLDLVEATEEASRLASLAGGHPGDDRVHLKKHQFEPELVNLVDNDEQGLVMLGGFRKAPLEDEQLGDFQVVGIGSGLIGHQKLPVPDSTCPS